MKLDKHKKFAAFLLAAWLLVGSAAATLAQAPAAIAGTSLGITITSGTYPFAPSGYFLFVPANSGKTYQIIGVSGVTNSTGTYTYAVTDAATAVMQFKDSAISTPFTVTLNFSSASTGTYLASLSAASAPLQAGGFQLFSQSAPKTLANRGFNLAANSGFTPFAETGTALLAISPSGKNYLLTGDNVNIVSSSGTCSYSEVNSTLGQLQLNDSISGRSTAYLGFTSSNAGAYAVKSVTPGGFQTGSFSIVDTIPPSLTASVGVGAKTTNGIVTIFASASDNVGLAGIYCQALGPQSGDLIQISGPYPTNVTSASVITNIDLSALETPGRFGTNLLQFYAVDTSSNVSVLLSRPVFWEVPTNMTVGTSGPGTITGLATGQPVYFGEAYAVTAHPAAGYVLQNWTDASGNTLTSDPSFSYYVGGDDGSAVLTANFVPNPYPALKGTYTGLFYDQANGATPTNAGFITVSLTSSGSYTGSVILGTNKYPITGQFQFPIVVASYPSGYTGGGFTLLGYYGDGGTISTPAQGAAAGGSSISGGDTSFSLLTSVPSASPNDLLLQGPLGINYSLPEVQLNSDTYLVLNLELDMDTNLSDFGAGSITGNVGAYGYSSTTDTNYWEVPLRAELNRPPTNLTTPGLYNIEIPPLSGDPSVAPAGYGYGAVTLAANGKVTMTLDLADGMSPPLTLSSVTAGDGTFPFFSTLYGGSGVILGWLQFVEDRATPADLESAYFSWDRMPSAGKLYTNGFTTMPGLPLTAASGLPIPVITGSRYAPAKTVPNILGGTYVQVVLNDGSLVVNTIFSYNPEKNVFTPQSINPDAVSLTLNPATGSLSGTFAPAKGEKPITFNGTFLPVRAAGYGFFPGTNSDIGSFSLYTFDSGSNLTFTETYADKLEGDLNNGFSVVTTGAGTVEMTLPLVGVDIGAFNANTPVAVAVSVFLGLNWNNVLGDDPTYRSGQTSATIHGVDLNGSNYTLLLNWTPTTLKLFGTFDYDNFGAEPYDQSPGSPGTQAISTPSSVSVTFAGYTVYDDIVPTTDRNTDQEIIGPDGKAYSLQSGILLGGADFTPPVVTITSPVANFRTTNGIIPLLAGTASDSGGLLQIYALVNNDPNNVVAILGYPASGLGLRSTPWDVTNLDLSMLPDPVSYGTNVLTVYAMDFSGNTGSATVMVIWAYPLPPVLTVPASSHGGVTGVKNGQPLQAGKGYPVTAKPAPGYVFLDWTDGSGKYLTNAITFTFVPTTNATLNANFVTNPYPAFAGTYRGLFSDPVNGVTPTNAGYLSVTLTTNGTYTGTLMLGPKSYPLAGQFFFPADAAQGDATNTTSEIVFVSATEELSLQFPLPLATPGTGLTTGTITAYNPHGGPYWTATCTLELSQFAASTNVEPGLYNLVIPGFAPQGPGGAGYGSVTLAANGSVALVLNLADGTSPTISFSTAVVTDGTFPFSASLYGGDGIILGWLQFTNDPFAGVDLEGTNVTWIKLPVNDKFYTNGFSTRTTPLQSIVFGSRYVAPKAGTNIFSSLFNFEGSSNLPIMLTDGNATTYVNLNATYNPQKNTFALPGANPQKLTLSFTPKTGAISGTFALPVGHGNKVVPFNGVLLPRTTAAYGFFAGTNQNTGQLNIIARPPNQFSDGAGGSTFSPGDGSIEIQAHPPFGSSTPANAGPSVGPLPPLLPEIPQ